MSKTNQVYKCSVCGNIIQFVDAKGPDVICCGKPMDLLEFKTQDKGNEKHVPVIEKTDKGFKVKVGSIPHPMEEEHFIQWVEVISNGKTCRKYLKPGQEPEAEFCGNPEDIEEVREYCNLHGLWKK